jgi:hypothetical protein
MSASTMPQTPREKAALQLKQFQESDHFHPLEAISFFRRWPRTFLRNFIYTLIMNTLFALLFTLLAYVFSTRAKLTDFPEILGNNLIISTVIGFGFWAVFYFIGPLLRIINRQHFAVLTLVYASIGTVIVTGSLWTYALATGRTGMLGWIGSREQFFTSFVISLVISLVMVLLWKSRSLPRRLHWPKSRNVPKRPNAPQAKPIFVHCRRRLSRTFSSTRLRMSRA